MHEPPNPFDCRCVWDGRGWARSQDCPTHRDLDIGAGTLPPVGVPISVPISVVENYLNAKPPFLSAMQSDEDVDLNGPCVKCGEKRSSIRHSAHAGSTAHAFQPPTKVRPYPLRRMRADDDGDIYEHEDGAFANYDEAQKAIQEAFWAGVSAFFNQSAFRWQFDSRVRGERGRPDAFKAWLETKRG